MTKVEAIAKIMEDNGGRATLSDIYDNITKYYPNARKSKDWEAGLRGVLYRDINNNRRFKKIGLSIYALYNYEEEKPNNNDAIRMHSYIEGICLEIGNFKKYNTYTADSSAIYRDNLKLSKFVSIQSLPKFSYDEIVQETKRIDVLWFNKHGLLFPQKAFEVVDSIGTLNGAFNRMLQLNNFRVEFYIVAPEKHRKKFEHAVFLERYNPFMDRFKFINYEEIIELYIAMSQSTKINDKIFGIK